MLVMVEMSMRFYNRLQNQNKICSYKKTELITTHPMIIDLLADRVKSVLINKLEA